MSHGSRPETLLRQVEDLFTAGVVGGLSDGELLERFLHNRSAAGEAAFRALVERHGPMVLRICKQTLNDRHAAEDAFQATFLVLARQACSIRKRDSVACWLFGVARRAAARIHVEQARRRRFERQSTSELSALTDQAEPSESWPELHDEVDRLPEKYRVPIVLCYFEGLTNEQAASLLRWPVGTVKIRLSRARDQLRSRLQKHGWPSAPMVLANLELPEIPTAIPRRLLSVTSELAARFTSSTAAGGVVSPFVLKITSGVLKAMWIDKLRLAGMVLFGVLGLGLGTAVVAQQAGKKPIGVVQPPATQSVPPTAATTGLRFTGVTGFDKEKVFRIRPTFDGRVEKVLVDLAARVKKGDPLVELFGKELADITNEIGVQKARMILHSPVDGRVIERSANPGELVRTKDTLLVVAEDDPLWVNASISSWNFAILQFSQNARLSFPSDPRIVNIKVQAIDPEIDRDTDMVKFRMSIPNPDHRLGAGMYVQVQLDPLTAPSGSSKPQPPADARSKFSVMERLNDVERKIDRLLKEKEDHASSASVLNRLDQIERKLNQLLDDGKRN